MLDKLERKFGRYAIKNLMRYIIVLYAIGFFLAIANARSLLHVFLSGRQSDFTWTGLENLYVSYELPQQ